MFTVTVNSDALVYIPGAWLAATAKVAPIEIVCVPAVERVPEFWPSWVMVTIIGLPAFIKVIV